MSKITITRKNATVSATYLPYTAYKAAHEGATARHAQIGTTAEGFFQATFNSVKDAKDFVSEWNANYEANRKVEVAPTKATAPTQKPKASKGKAEAKPTASSTKKSPRKAKGNNLDFTKVKGKTKSERNRNAHALIIATGVKSGSAEYMALWNEWTNAR